MREKGGGVGEGGRGKRKEKMRREGKEDGGKGGGIYNPMQPIDQTYKVHTYIVHVAKVYH